MKAGERVTLTITTDGETCERMTRALDQLIGEFDLIVDVRRE